MAVLKRYFADLLNYLESEERMKKRVLLIEESTSKIATIQGYLVGSKEYKDLQKLTNFTVDKEAGTGANPIFNTENYSLEELKDAITYIDGAKNLEEYKAFEEERKKEIDRMKNFLFFESEKSRDLYFCKGWYDGIMQVDAFIKELHKSFVSRKKDKAESLPFYD